MRKIFQKSPILNGSEDFPSIKGNFKPIHNQDAVKLLFLVLPLWIFKEKAP
jgi:hypothetical protein